MADEHTDAQRGAGGCGCAAAAAFLALVALPILLIFSFGLSPCEGGPCNPNGARNFRAAAAIFAAVAAAIGIGTWALVRWWDRRQAPDEIERGRKQLVLYLTVPLVAAAAAVTALVWL